MRARDIRTLAEDCLKRDSRIARHDLRHELPLQREFEYLEHSLHDSKPVEQQHAVMKGDGTLGPVESQPENDYLEDVKYLSEVHTGHLTAQKLAMPTMTSTLKRDHKTAYYTPYPPVPAPAIAPLPAPVPAIN
jgi:hypothetical protein